MSPKSYAIGYASGRGVKCNKDGTGCIYTRHQYLVPGALQFTSNHSVRKKPRPNWRHLECICEEEAANLRKRFNIFNINDIKGYLNLGNEDKARVDELLGIAGPHRDADVECASGARRTTARPRASHSSSRNSWDIIQQHLDQYQDAWWRKSWSEAERSLKAAMALCNEEWSPLWYVWGMQVATAQRDWDKAMLLAQEAEQIYPDSVDVLVASAHVALITDHLPESLASLQFALEQEPNHIGTKALLQRLQSIDRARQDGDQIYATSAPLASEKYTEALDVLGCEEEDGRGGYLRVLLLGSRAASFTQMKRLDLARDDCEAALSVSNHPWQIEVMDKLAKCHIALGDPTAARRQAEAALELNPLDNSILTTKLIAEWMEGDLQLSQDAWDRRDWSRAKSALDRVLVECIGGYPLVWRVFKVEVEIATRHWEDAVSTAETAVELYPSSPYGFVALGLALMLSNKLGPCIAALGSALRLDPEHPLATSTSYKAQEIERIKEEGDQAFRLGKYDEAVHKYTETLAILGSDEEDGGGGYLRAVLSANRAAALHKIEKHTQALTDILASLELDPSSYEALRTHAHIRMAQGYYAEAITIYTRAQNLWMCGEQNPADGQAIAEELRYALEASESKDDDAN